MLLRITDPSSLNMLGFNKQPAVCSRKQFKFLKQMNSDGWQRVLQRLAEKELHGKSTKFSTVQWDDIISKLLLDPLANDYTVYSTIRRYVLDSSLDEDLQITASHSNSGAKVILPLRKRKIQTALEEGMDEPLFWWG